MSLNLEKSADASSPILILVTDIENTLSRKKYISYYEIPSFPGQYRPLENLQEIFLPSPILKFKILNLSQPQNFPLIKQANVVVDEKVSIEMKMPDGLIKISGQIINQTKNQGKVFAMSIVDRLGYTDFYNFRKKYKTLENLTRKQEFSIDHRIKVTEMNNTFYYNMQADDQTKYFFTGKKLKIELEEIYSIEEWQSTQSIYEETVDLSNAQTSQTGEITILDKLKLTIGIQLVKNENLSMCDMVSLRILELSQKNKQIVVGTDRYEECSKLNPLLDDMYYDYEYAYLTKNLKQLQEGSIHSHLDKLTPCFPNYPHFINQKIIEVQNSKFLIFRIDSNVIKIPLVYILQGFNVFNTQNMTIKFLIQAAKITSQSQEKQQTNTGKRAVYELKIRDIWNLGSLKIDQPNFDIKIISQNNIYYIPFQQVTTQINNFRKQSKNLELKEQYSEKDKNKLYIISKSEEKGKINLMKTQHLQDFYLLDMQSTGSISFQVSSSKEMYVVGALSRSRIINTKEGGIVKLILSSNDNFDKVVLICQLNQIQQSNSSMKSLYKIRHRLYFTDDSPCDDAVYDLEVKKAGNNKKLKTKIYPEIKSQFLSIVKEFDEGFFSSLSPQLDMTISLRKMYYNEQLQIFDNEEIVNKRVIVNAEAGSVLQKNCLFVRINEQSFQGIDYDFYDANIKKKLKLYIQVYRCQSPFFDFQSASYSVKIPYFLWKLNNIGNSPSTSMELHYSNKRKKSQKVSLYSDSPQEYNLPFYNYKDGISVMVGGQIGYSKIIDALTVKCDVVKDSIGWIPESQWYLGILQVGNKNFYFQIKCSFNPNADRERSGSSKSDRTVGKQGSQRSYGEKIDPLAKTVRNMQVFKLKKVRNDAVLEGRQLTTRYVKKQEMIISLSKKITQAEELIRKRREKEAEITSEHSENKKKKDSVKMTSFYRSICQCGARNPKFNGFCEECLKKLRKRYEIYLKQYKQKAYEYQKICFNKFNTKQKLIRVKNKLKVYHDKIKSGQNIQDNNMNDMFKELEQKELKRKIEQIKIQLFRLQQQRKSITETGLYQKDLLQERIKKEEQEIWEGKKQLEKVNHELTNLNQMIYEQ